MDLKTGHIEQELLSDFKEVNRSETSAIQTGLGRYTCSNPTHLAEVSVNFGIFQVQCLRVVVGQYPWEHRVLVQIIVAPP